MTEKARFRHSMKHTLSVLDENIFKTQGIEAGKLIVDGSVWKKARSVLLFMSMKSEIDTHFLLEEALSSGKNLFVPRILQDDMAFFKINSLVGPWDKGVFGIFEPKMNQHNQFNPADIDFPLLIIVPGLAFDKKGHRLGRGKGYYDKFLSKIRLFSRKNSQNVTIMGFCLHEQLVDHVPTEDFDQKVDVICAGNDYIEIE
jgi:5-formyltetrahydrofolate cyclo-ligase